MASQDVLKAKVIELKGVASNDAGLDVELDFTRSPTTISFYKNQISLFENPVREKSPSLTFTFGNSDMYIETQNGFEISEAVFNKLKKLSKDVNQLFLYAFFERFSQSTQYNPCEFYGEEQKPAPDSKLLPQTTESDVVEATVVESDD